MWFNAPPSVAEMDVLVSFLTCLFAVTLAVSGVANWFPFLQLDWDVQHGSHWDFERTWIPFAIYISIQMWNLSLDCFASFCTAWQECVSSDRMCTHSLKKRRKTTHTEKVYFTWKPQKCGGFPSWSLLTLLQTAPLTGPANWWWGE